MSYTKITAFEKRVFRAMIAVDNPLVITDASQSNEIMRFTYWHRAPARIRLNLIE